MEMQVTTVEAGLRLDALLKSHLPDCSRAKIQQAIKNGNCWLDAQKITDPAYRTKLNQKIKITLENPQASLEPISSDLEIVWQDESIAICAKPAGLTVHPCPSCSEETLANQLLAKFPQLTSQGGERPGIAHRLDKDTSGIIAIGLDEKSRLRLSEMFALRKIHKEYLALVAGDPPLKGECREPIGRHPAIKTRMAVIDQDQGGKPAHTEWRKLWSNGKFSLLRIVIHTGRTHQIRVHMAHLGYPLLGDKTYAPKSVACLAPRQMLHAARIKFTHPGTSQIVDVSLPPPDDFIETALANCQKLRRIVVTGNQGCGKSSFCGALAELDLPVISADAIVAQLYSHESDATFWIRQNLGEDAVNSDNTIDKKRLFAILREKPVIKREFERAIHALVEAEIERFWQANAAKFAAVAEIPLYFESSLQEMQTERPFVVGINCPRAIRWQRIADNRGWSKEKIAAIESWQWAEEKKMAACDEVYDNLGEEGQLAEAAKAFVAGLETRAANENRLLRARFKELCDAGASLREG